MRFIKGIVVFLIFAIMVMAQDTTKVKATSTDISENLDLRAVATVFGEAKDLEEFEKMLNDPEKQISNLDLNEDGEVDYLRVMETVKGNTHYIAIQAVLGKDMYQDVASVEVDKSKKGEETVQVVGDTYIYGDNYIIEPVYVKPPVIYVYFWAPAYHPWHSPWYWGYHPPYYRPWRPYPPYHYHKNVYVNVNVNYRHTTVRHSSTAVNIQKEQRRNDYGAKHPNKSFENRNKGVNNSRDLKPAVQPSTKPANRDAKPAVQPAKKDVHPAFQPANKDAATPSTGRQVNDKWQPSNKRDAASPSVQPSTKPSTTPSNRQSVQPSTMPSNSNRQSVQPSTMPSNNKQSVQPSNRQNTTPSNNRQNSSVKPANRKGGGGGRRR